MESKNTFTIGTHADGNFLVLNGDQRIGPFSSHWAACAAMIRLHNPSFVSLGGDKADDLAIEARAAIKKAQPHD